MYSNDQTALLPRQPAEPATVTGSAPVSGGLGGGPDGSPDGRRRALSTLACTLPTVLMAILGFIRPAWPSLDAAELGRWGYAVAPWSPAWRLDGDSAPYVFALHGWAQVFGASDFALRLPSLLAMTAAAGLVAALGTRLAGPRAGFLAGLLFTVLPTSSRYAQQIGPQALASCFAVLATLALVAVLDRPKCWRYAGYGAAVALLGLTAAPALALLVAHLFAVLLTGRRVFAGWLAAALGSLLPAGLALWLLTPPTIRLSWVAPVDLPALARLPQDLFGVALPAGILLGLGLLSWSFRRPAAIFASWAVVPALCLYAAAQLAPVWSPQQLLYTLPGWALLGALALDRALMVRAVTAAVAVALLCLPAQIGIRQRDGHGQASAALAAVITAQAQPGDAVVYGPAAQDGRIGRDLLARYVPAQRRPRDALATRPPRTDGQLLAAECSDVDRCLANAARVWLLRAGPAPDPLDAMPAAKDGALRARYQISHVWTFTGLTLTLFTLAPGSTAQPPAR